MSPAARERKVTVQGECHAEFFVNPGERDVDQVSTVRRPTVVGGRHCRAIEVRGHCRAADGGIGTKKVWFDLRPERVARPPRKLAVLGARDAVVRPLDQVRLVRLEPDLVDVIVELVDVIVIVELVEPDRTRQPAARAWVAPEGKARHRRGDDRMLANTRRRGRDHGDHRRRRR